MFFEELYRHLALAKINVNKGCTYPGGSSHSPESIDFYSWDRALSSSVLNAKLDLKQQN